MDKQTARRCPHCGVSVADRRRTYCSETCRYHAHLARKRATHNTRPEEKRKQNARSLGVYYVLETQPCRVCGSPMSERHHPDYGLPAEVEFYCHRHHMQMHRGLIDGGSGVPFPSAGDRART